MNTRDEWILLDFLTILNTWIHQFSLQDRKFWKLVIFDHKFFMYLYIFFNHEKFNYSISLSLEWYINPFELKHDFKSIKK